MGVSLPSFPSSLVGRTYCAIREGRYGILEGYRAIGGGGGGMAPGEKTQAEDGPCIFEGRHFR